MTITALVAQLDLGPAAKAAPLDNLSSVFSSAWKGVVLVVKRQSGLWSIPFETKKPCISYVCVKLVLNCDVAGLIKQAKF